MSQFYTASQAGFRLSSSNSAWMNQMLMSGRSRQAAISFALAMAVNKMSDLPAGRLADDNAGEYFLNQAGIAGSTVAGVINELMPVDIREVLRLAKSLYTNRYEQAYRPYEEFGVNRSKGIASIFGLNYHFSEDTLDVVRTQGQAITDAYSRFVEIIKELKKG